MTNKLEFYRCEICGNLVQIIFSGDGNLVCCGQEMLKLENNWNDEGTVEKHVPVFEKSDDGKITVKVGDIPHPMTDEHYIQFIETISEDKNCICLKYLHPNDEPKVELSSNEQIASAREYCNIHGLWEGHND